MALRKGKGTGTTESITIILIFRRVFGSLLYYLFVPVHKERLLSVNKYTELGV